MENLMRKFEEKLVAQSLILPGTAVMGQWDAGLEWNRPDPTVAVLAPLFDHLNISTVLFARPAEPYGTIMDYLAQRSMGVIHLKDNETRTFLHDIPVLHDFTSEAMAGALKGRKAAILPGRGLVTYGTVSPEQTFVNFSSVLFSCFVKFFSDYLAKAFSGTLEEEDRKTFDHVLSGLPAFSETKASFRKGPFDTEEAVCGAVCEAGKPVVNYGLVDSVMGNISCCFDHKVYISQTGSFLDELEGCVDACPMDHSSCTGITASSELPTHMAVYRNSYLKTILHGHPKFAVIMSMYCEREKDCPLSGECHTKCPEKRTLGTIPIVTGEGGSGPLSISRTVPSAMMAAKGVIVYGHGVFTGGETDFNEPFERLCSIEKTCREAYFNRLGQFKAVERERLWEK
ncbi:MAG: class II aldolase/adducin family protein [Proteobacteria bacterium]|nr:class II aldolase/adducin family protein [Pseudomonadota bacterium]MBU4469195.1 class II aldolase/adducin family protein [Pseudomonadota bacterium]